MKYEPIARPSARSQDSLASDFGLIFEAIADAFRALTSPSPLESRSSRLRDGGRY